MFPGETVGSVKGYPPPEDYQCDDCGNAMFLQVCKSGAGYYLGYICEMCGPYSRETDYMPRTIAHDMLATKENPIWLDYWRR